ncbi:chromatin-binding protein CTF4 KNAG_0A07770 [Huiozyma naganishii CBS 8797]|uniref:Uncharacterized protein n=1 Tax=Huiozyma naganishii (strain ATCC MYA-139 / BCRC 22969 / CBS 8797 / KCTC 17520 / NBRC 10181 / NCYC 3082 / Yp74L-3) TaxID=1071383 RepID=J7S300_HUIN7|nr:hypothetical protein KNAG_0A07770 [Kazachstania naganishii CBS 8797]CCK68429.1 hypothetical protein KNAG_0A07770 [Kazachstania naganishii CBS 8797]
MPEVVKKPVFEYGGKTLLSLGFDNNTLFAANKKGLTKILALNHPEKEPEVIDILEGLTSICTVSNSKFVLTSSSGDAIAYDYKSTAARHQLLARFGLPVRDCVSIHNGKMFIMGGDDLVLASVEVGATGNNNIKIREQISQLSYSPTTNLLAVSFIDGTIQFFSLTSAVPNKVKELDGYINKNSYSDENEPSTLDKIIADDVSNDSDDNDLHISDAEFQPQNRICTRVAWHPTGLNFAIPCSDLTVKVFSLKNYELLKTLVQPPKTSSVSKFIDLKFDSSQGTHVAAVNLDNELIVWDWEKSEVTYQRKFSQQITNFVWKIGSDSKTLDIILGTWSGYFIHVKDAVNTKISRDDTEGSKGTKVTSKSVFVQDDDSDEELDEVLNEGKPKSTLVDGVAEEGGSDDEDSNSNGVFTQERKELNDLQNGKKRNLSEEEEEEEEEDSEAEEFIDDDDGAGYVPAKKQKMSLPIFDKSKSFTSGRLVAPPTFRYKPISPGATPFGVGDRRYLTMNSIGYVSTVKNNEQFSITVSFFDIGRFTEYHFEDLFGFDTCFLNENGTLFAQSKSGQLHYRPYGTFHSNWTKTIPLSKGEIITAVAATPQRIIVGTSFGYIRIFNQYAVPITVEKMSPVVTLTALDYKVFTVHYSPFHGISYSLLEQSPTKSRYFQRECPLPIILPQNMDQTDEFGASSFTAFNPLGIKSVFFSQYGDPCIFGNDNVLLVLSKWTSPTESRWVPLLDSNLELWKMTGGKDKHDIHVWPLGLSFDTLNCILVKGKNAWPGFPLPLPSEMEVRIPVLVKQQIWEETLSKRDEDEDAQADSAELGKDKGDGISGKEIKVPDNMAAEEELMRSKILSGLLSDTLENEGELFGNENEIIAQLNNNYDKALLRLFAVACSTQDSDKALSLVQELKQDRALTAAAKIAERAEMMSLMKRINDIRETRFERQMDSMK